jgi:hypothetical protein
LSAWAWPACAAIALFAGCGSSGQTGAALEQVDDFFPMKIEPGPVNLKLANVEIKAMATVAADGLNRTLTLTRNGAALEREVFEVTSDRIAIVELGSGERFSPPLTLLRFPMKIGDRFDWTGKLLVGNRPLDSQAAATTETSRLDLATGSLETVHVTIQLRISDGSPKPAERKLEFWFARGKGPVKRDYGGQIREPRLP